MKDVNEHHIHTYALEFHNENEITAHWGGGLEGSIAISER